MRWEPGRPVVTTEDVEAWRAWRKASKLQQQRERRAMYPRIDYYPSKEARALILAHYHEQPGGYSGTIDRIIREWAGIPE